MDDKNSLTVKSESSSSLDQHSHSMDRSRTKKSNMSSAGFKKSWSKLSQRSVIDPKRARRILAKRKFFERLRERKRNQYHYNLAKNVRALQTTARSITAETSMYKREALRIAAENNVLKLVLQNVEEQNKWNKAIIDALKEKLQRLKAEVMLEEILKGQHDYDNNQAMNTFLAVQQFQQEDEEENEDDDDDDEEEEDNDDDDEDEDK